VQIVETTLVASPSIAFNTENLKSILLVVSFSTNKPAIQKERAHDAPVPQSIRLQTRRPSRLGLRL
jgi:hypothetical protein